MNALVTKQDMFRNQGGIDSITSTSYLYPKKGCFCPPINRGYLADFGRLPEALKRLLGRPMSMYLAPALRALRSVLACAARAPPALTGACKLPMPLNAPNILLKPSLKPIDSIISTGVLLVDILFCECVRSQTWWS